MDPTFLTGIFCCQADFDTDKGYLISCGVVEETCPNDYNNILPKVSNGSPGCWSLMSRCKLVNRRLEYTSKKTEAVLIKNERIEAILEYAKNKMILSIYPTDLLVLDNWKKGKVIFKL